VSNQGGEQTLELRGLLPGMNEFMDARRVSYREGKRGRFRDAYTSIKAKWTRDVAIECRAAGIRRVPRAFFEFHWRERNRRRNPDNVAAGGRKLILDGLVVAGVLDNDGWREIAGWRDLFTVDAKNPGVTVIIREMAEDERGLVNGRIP